MKFGNGTHGLDITLEEPGKVVLGFMHFRFEYTMEMLGACFGPDESGGFQDPLLAYAGVKKEETQAQPVQVPLPKPAEPVQAKPVEPESKDPEKSVAAGKSHPDTVQFDDYENLLKNKPDFRLAKL